MLIFLYGDIRQGKTNLTTIFALDSERKVFSNYKIDIPNYNQLTYSNILEIPNNSDVFIDEAYTWLESRKSSKDVNVLISHILFQSGKRNIDIYINSQLQSSVDIRFREMANILIECFKHQNLEVFQYDIYVKKKGISEFNKTFLLPFEQAELYYKYYDTFEIVDSDLSEKFTLNSIMNDGKKLYRYIQDLSVEIKPLLEGKKATIRRVKMSLLRKGYSQTIVNKLYGYVYDYLNENIKK